MKNLKRVLALVISLVFVMSTVAFADTTPTTTPSTTPSTTASTDTTATTTPATTTTTDTVTEAQKVLSQLNIMVGTDNGFEGDKALTRAEAARLMYSLAVSFGGEVATGATSFTDVATSHWASGYIANLNGYKVNGKAIINGVSDTTFVPDQNVSYDQFNTMAEADRYSVKTGMAMAVQTDSKECGDSFDFYRLPDNRFVMALSDGMGSGQAAARESRATLDLLKEFLSAGFDKETALELINSALLLKSAEESFATIDLSMISLTTGDAEFVKIGSATTFIKHLTYVETIYSTSLPAGILSSIDAELSSKTLEDGDLIILMSDGVLESDHRHAISEEWVLDFLQKNDDILDPQIMADKLLAEALKNCEGKPRDDMTVLVSRILTKQN